MTMQGIDISSYQAGINLANLPIDFVIVKATEGTGYTNPDCARAVEQALAAGKIVGVYHYVNGAGSAAEADHFVSSCKGWIGKVIFAIDWEAGGNKAWGNTGYLDAVIKRVKASTGKAPLLYASASVFPWAIAKANDCGTWVAEYANTKATGFQTSPWHSRSWTGACLIRQYTDNLRISGWNGGLDGNVAFCDRATLARYISGTASASAASKPAASTSTASIASSGTTKAKTKTDGQLEIAQDGVLGSSTIARWQQVMGTSIDGKISSGGSQLVVAFQKFLNSVVAGNDQKNLHGVAALATDGILGPATWKTFQFWSGNKLPGDMKNICGFTLTGSTIGKWVDGVAGKWTIIMLQVMLNRSYAGSGKLLSK